MKSRLIELLAGLDPGVVEAGSCLHLADGFFPSAEQDSHVFSSVTREKVFLEKPDFKKALGLT